MRSKLNSAETTPSEETVGSRLRQIRIQRKMTVKEVANLAGVSVGMISQIERDISSPSIRILERLRTAMDIPLMALLETSDQPGVSQNSIIRRKSDRLVMEFKHGDVTKQMLSPVGDHDIQFMKITLRPGVNQTDVLIGSGEKAGLVVSGQVVLDVNGSSYVLEQGDSFQFSSGLPHGIRNASDADAEVLWIMNTKQSEAAI
ncbi:cupin domain-containing protein [Ensifer adhaerens]|nr:cupin domain-containing protein [Ensifer adhaerens]MBZ7924878.1 cupin domain-containing protein [Ensifer adhaerens]UAX95907.1 cupin domain-containing protein [Ensifer adhaerens]UAY10182.1 cupin domain-containing protein [Ensifer adhaerens]